MEARQGQLHACGLAQVIKQIELGSRNGEGDPRFSISMRQGVGDHIQVAWLEFYYKIKTK